MLRVKIKIVEEVASADDFLRLRKIFGLSERPLEAAIKTLPRSLYGVHNYYWWSCDRHGKIVEDGALNFEIVDIAVDPKYQKQGFGHVIMGSYHGISW